MRKLYVLKSVFLVFFLHLFNACATQGAPKSSAYGLLNNEYLYLVGSTLWFQRAAEVKALSHQAFNLATMQLNLAVEWNESPKPKAIIVDIDETILDNSPYQARVILNREGFDPKTWEKWVDQAQASPLPGAVEFMNHAYELGVELFYVTNRLERGREATLENLESWGFPVKSQNLLMRTDERSKESRRLFIEQDYEVVLLLGDQLEDFSGEFDELSLKERREMTEKFRDEFGHRFIMLPNSMYGRWEQLIYREAEQKGRSSKVEAWFDFLVPDAL